MTMQVTSQGEKFLTKPSSVVSPRGRDMRLTKRILTAIMSSREGRLTAKGAARRIGMSGTTDRFTMTWNKAIDQKLIVRG